MRLPFKRETTGMIVALALVVAALPGPAAAGDTPATDHADAQERTDLRTATDGLIDDRARTRVLVLGTRHLSTLGERYQPAMLDTLIESLAAWGPDAIGVETLPPEVIREMLARRKPVAGVASQFAGAAIDRGETMRNRLGIGLQEALNTSTALLARAQKEDDLAAPSRSELVSHLIAAYRWPSAVLQWRRLDDEARASADLPDSIARALDSDASGRANEIYSIGVRLAERQGLSQLYPIDDHLDKDAFYYAREEVTEPLMRILREHPSWQRVERWTQAQNRHFEQAVEKGDLLPFYRWSNTDAQTQADARAQWGGFLETAGESPFLQKRVAGWEIRNLNIASHIREMTLYHPGGRVLVIIGGGHKPFLDDYLGRMLDVEVIELETVLNAASNGENRVLHSGDAEG